MRRIPLSVLLLALPLALAPGRASAAWPTGSIPNVPVCTAPNGQSVPAVAPDSCGGAIMAWQDPRSATRYQVFVQRIDAFGQPRWPLNGFPISTSTAQQNEPDLCPDGLGGAYVAWDEQRTAAQGRDIFVQHVLSTGVVDPAWPSDGVVACSLPNDQIRARIMSVNAGGAVVAWMDLGNGSVDIGYDLGAQRLASSGALLWGPNGVELAGGYGDQAWFDSAPTGDGGLVAAYEDTRSGNNNVVAQRLDGAGSRLWGADGVVLCNVLQATAGVGSREVRAAYDGGRAFFAWENRTIPPAPDRRDAYVQAVDLAGSVLWTGNGVTLTSGDSGYWPRLVPDGLGGAIVAWNFASSTAIGIAAQRIGVSGSPLWAPAGVVLRNGPGIVASAHCIVTDSRHGAIVVWEDYRSGQFTQDLYARRISDTGTPLWAIDGTPVATSPESQDLRDFGSFPERAVPDGAGGAVIAWGDYRGISTTGWDIYAQQIGANGLTGVRAPSANCQPDICGFAYDDFGDAPENIPAFPSGSFGHYPTCKALSSPGTQEIECAGAAPSTAPGPTGYVEHIATNSDTRYVSLGCAAAPALIAVDSELDGLVNVGGGPPPLMPTTSACDPAAVLDTYEDAFGGLWFGGDEKAGPASVALKSNPVFLTCTTASLHLRTSACGPGSTTAYLNVLADWNQDGDWNDVIACGGAGSGNACAAEWAVKNAQVTVRPGCDSLDAPAFRVGPYTGGSWMRVTLTLSPVTDDFPWAGSAVNPQPGGGATGSFAGGETEDYPISIVTSNGVGEETVGPLSFERIAPNPARGNTEMRFTLPAAAEVRLGVFDLAGRRVRTLAASRLAAGSHAVRWDGRDESGSPVGSGLFFVRLEVAGRSLTHSIVRLR